MEDKFDREVRKREAAGYTAVGKRRQVDCTALEKMIHNPHLV